MERLDLIDREAPELPRTLQADLLGLNRTSLYYQPAPPAPEEVTIKHAIDRIYTDNPVYGSRRIAVLLKQAYQFVINRKVVQRHMREMGIAGICARPNLSKRNPEHRIYP